MYITHPEIYTAPFTSLSNFQLESLFHTAHARITRLLADNKIEKYLANTEVAHKGKSTCGYFDEEQFYRTSHDIKNKIAIFHLNIRSLRKHSLELIAFLECLKLKFDVILLSEIGRHNDHLSNLLDGYTFVQVPSMSPKGGVGIYFKGSFSNYTVSYNRIGQNKTCNCQNCQIEDIWLDIEIYNKPCVIWLCYRHPNGNVTHFVEALETVLDSFTSNCLAYFVGDINIDLLKHDTCPTYDNYLTAMLSHRFLPTITLPTRLTDNTLTLIDHIFVRLPDHLISTTIQSGNLYCDISDHLPNFCLISNDTVITGNTRPLIRLYTERNFINFNYNIGNSSFNDILTCDSVNDAYSLFENELKTCQENSFPMVKQSRSKYKSKPWVTSAIRNSICHKNRLYRIFLAKPSLVNKLNLSNYRYILTETIKTAQATYYLNILNSRNTSTKKAWSVINNLINTKTKRSSTVINSINYSGQTVTDGPQISNAFNHYFSTIGQKLASALPRSDNPRTYFDNPVGQSIFLTPITANEMLIEINKLKLGKSPGLDGLNAKLLKSVAEYIAPVLTHIFNLCFETGEYPQALKTAKVVPLFKKGDNKLPENYRPISLLSCINKLLEKTLEKRLRLFLLQNDIFFDFQFGFRSGHSTTQALLEITNNIRYHLDKGENVLGLYLDLKKAFDTVNHDILKQKLYNYGIRGKCYDLLVSYLTNRLQIMFVNGIASTPKVVLTGVPQGSVLGPLLFLIYINDIRNAVHNVSIRLFADDTNIFVYSRDCGILIDDTKRVVRNLKTWFDANKLTLHLGKTNYTIFHSTKRHHICFDQFDFDNIIINRTDTTKYLGLIIDHELSWKQHIDALCSSLIKYVGIFYKIRDCIPDDTRLQLYNAFVFSRISYGIEIYGMAKQSIIRPLQIMQNRILKTLTYKPRRYPTNTLYFDNEILQINEIHREKIYTLLYKYTCGKLPSIFHEIFKPNIHTVNRATRHNQLFIVSHFKKFHGRMLLNNYGRELWQPLPHDIKNSSSLHTYKQKIRKYLLSEYA